jgi:hypothetical protein
MKALFKLFVLVTPIGWLLWFELVTVPTALARHLDLSQQFSLAVGGWQIIKLVLLGGGCFIAGNRLGRKGVFDTYTRLMERQVTPLTNAIAHLHKDVTGTLNTTVGRAVLDGTKLGVRMSGDTPQVSRTDLLAGLDQFALPPVTGRWEVANDEQTELDTYKNNLH